jgi:hypothetical protein
VTAGTIASKPRFPAKEKLVMKNQNARRGWTLALASVALLAFGAAQAPAQTVDPRPQGSENEPHKPLGQQLSETGPVITPPKGIDPEIHVPAPDPTPGTTPVIPPDQLPGRPARPQE